MNITTIGIDLAKNTFSLVGMNEYGKIVVRKTLSRRKLMPFIAQCQPCFIGMEALTIGGVSLVSSVIVSVLLQRNLSRLSVKEKK